MNRNNAISLLMQMGARSLAQEYIETAEDQNGGKYWDKFDSQEELLDDFDRFIKECANDVDVCNSTGHQISEDGPLKIDVNVENRGIPQGAAEKFYKKKVFDRTGDEPKEVGFVNEVLCIDGICQLLNITITSEDFKNKLLSGKTVSYAIEGDEK